MRQTLLWDVRLPMDTKLHVLYELSAFLTFKKDPTQKDSLDRRSEIEAYFICQSIYNRSEKFVPFKRSTLPKPLIQFVAVIKDKLETYGEIPLRTWESLHNSESDIDRLCCLVKSELLMWKAPNYSQERSLLLNPIQQAVFRDYTLGRFIDIEEQITLWKVLGSSPNPKNE